MREDFPTLDLPIKAISGNLGAGHSESLEADLRKLSDRICIFKQENKQLKYRDFEKFFQAKKLNQSQLSYLFIIFRGTYLSYHHSHTIFQERKYKPKLQS